MADNCAIWSQTSILWKNANWKWSECSGTPVPPTPIINLNLPGVDASTLIHPWLTDTEPWDAYKQIKERNKRLVKLVCKVKGTKYEEEKERKPVDLEVKSVQTVVNPAISIELKMEK